MTRQNPRQLAAVQMMIFRIAPAKLLLIGYLTYITVGWALLALPVAQAVPPGAIDALIVQRSIRAAL